MSKKSLIFKVGILALFAMLLASTNPAAVIAGPKSCDSRINNTQKKLQECVTVEGVREHQAALQAIADVFRGEATSFNVLGESTAGKDDAVLALESALLDEHSSVRSQAINALGLIGGERATIALGNILLNGSADKTERVMAAQALWKHDSEAARRYLRTGANDTDEQVRLASSKAPSPSKLRVTTDQLGPAKTQ